MKRPVVLALLATLAGLPLVGCEEKSGTGTGGGSALDKIGDAVGDAAKDATDSAKGAVDSAKQAAGDAVDSAKEQVGEMADAAKNTAVKTAEDSFTAVKAQVQKLTGLKVPDSMKGAFDEAMKAINGDVSKADGLIGQLKGAGMDQWKGIADQLMPLIDSIKKQATDAMAKFGAGQ